MTQYICLISSAKQSSIPISLLQSWAQKYGPNITLIADTNGTDAHQTATNIAQKLKPTPQVQNNPYFSARTDKEMKENFRDRVIAGVNSSLPAPPHTLVVIVTYNRAIQLYLENQTQLSHTKPKHGEMIIVKKDGSTTSVVERS